MRVSDIIFSGPMVRALLEDRKTQTRRLAWKVFRWPLDDWDKPYKKPTRWLRMWERFQEGGPQYRELLYVREAHYLTDDGHDEYAVYATDKVAVARHVNEVGNLAARYGFDEEWLKKHVTLRPSIHMPRWASRLTLDVHAVKRQRLQEISEHDAQIEGAQTWWASLTAQERAGLDSSTGRQMFRHLWDALHTKPGERWSDNPEVVALTFTVHKQNVDDLLRERQAA